MKILTSPSELQIPFSFTMCHFYFPWNHHWKNPLNPFESHEIHGFPLGDGDTLKLRQQLRAEHDAEVQQISQAAEARMGSTWLMESYDEKMV